MGNVVHCVNDMEATSKEIISLNSNLNELRSMIANQADIKNIFEKYKQILSSVSLEMRKLEKDSSVYSAVFKAKVYETEVPVDYPTTQESQKYFGFVSAVYKLAVHLIQTLSEIKERYSGAMLDEFVEIHQPSGLSDSNIHELGALYTDLLESNISMGVVGSDKLSPIKKIFPEIKSSSYLTRLLQEVVSQSDKEFLLNCIQLRAETEKNLVVIKVVEGDGGRKLQLYSLFPKPEDFALFFVADIGAWFNVNEQCIELPITNESHEQIKNAFENNKNAVPVNHQASIKLIQFFIENVDYIYLKDAKILKGNYVKEKIDLMSSDSEVLPTSVESMLRPS